MHFLVPVFAISTLGRLGIVSSISWMFLELKISASKILSMTLTFEHGYSPL